MWNIIVEFASTFTQCGHIYFQAPMKYYKNIFFLANLILICYISIMLSYLDFYLANGVWKSSTKFKFHIFIEYRPLVGYIKIYKFLFIYWFKDRINMQHFYIGDQVLSNIWYLRNLNLGKMYSFSALYDMEEATLSILELCTLCPFKFPLNIDQFYVTSDTLPTFVMLLNGQPSAHFWLAV